MGILRVSSTATIYHLKIEIKQRKILRKTHINQTSLSKFHAQIRWMQAKNSNFGHFLPATPQKLEKYENFQQSL